MSGNSSVGRIRVVVGILHADPESVWMSNQPSWPLKHDIVMLTLEVRPAHGFPCGNGLSVR
jgi:hypothetical protein